MYKFIVLQYNETQTKLEDNTYGIKYNKQQAKGTNNMRKPKTP